MIKLWIGIIALLIVLSGALYWNIRSNTRLMLELDLKEKAIEQTQRDIEQLAERLNNYQQAVRENSRQRQERDRNPDISVEQLQQEIEGRSK